MIDELNQQIMESALMGLNTKYKYMHFKSWVINKVLINKKIMI
jgi:hypothetical protein